MIADYHIHTKLCKHACGEPDEYIQTAIKRKIAEIGFADHCPYPEGFDTRFRMAKEQFCEYRKIVSDMQKKYSYPKIRYGLEVDWVPNRMHEVFPYIDNENFDYLIGSVHYTDDFPFDNPEIEEEWKKDGTADKVWNSYMETAMEMVASAKFDIIGHFDLPKKFGFYPKDMEIIYKKAAEILSAAADLKIAIEINTSGLRKKAAEIYPSLKILSIARKCGTPITFGSDAHAPDEVGADFDQALQLAKFAGYTHFCIFSERKASIVKLP